MFVQANFVDIYLQGMRDRSMRSGTEVAREIELTDWSTAANLPNQSSGVQLPRDICTRLKRYLYSAKCSWIIKTPNPQVSFLGWKTTMSRNYQPMVKAARQRDTKQGNEDVILA